MEMSVTDTDRTDSMRDPAVAQAAGPGSKKQPGRVAEGMGNGGVLHGFPWDPKPALTSCP